MFQHFKVLCTFFLVSAFTPLSAIANPLDDGLAAYETGDLTGAFSHFMQAAKSGDAEGQYYVGLMYFEGKGVTQSNSQAAEWFRKSAAQNNADAMTYLGGLHEEGKGVPFSIEKAKFWFTKGAAEGDQYAKQSLKRLATTDPDKQLEMANWYVEGDKAPLNKPLAAYWYEKSAQQGNDTAMTYLGGMLEKGDGIPRNRTAALTWYEKAAKKGNWIAQDMADELEARMNLEAGNTKPDGFYDDGKSAVARPAHKLPEGFSLYTKPSSQLPLDDIKALMTKANAGDVDAQETLGLMYFHGKGVPQSYEKAEPWLDKASIERRVDAMMAYAEMFEKGLGVRQEEWAAKFWYGEAAKKGNAEAKAWVEVYDTNNPSTSITVRAKTSYGPPPKITVGPHYKTRELTQREKDFETIGHDVGVEFYNEGKYATARHTWEPYAEAGLAKYQLKLGLTYLKEKNYGPALTWFKRAAAVPEAGLNEFDVAEAQGKVGAMYVEGLGVDVDLSHAAGWLTLATDRLVPDGYASRLLGLMYKDGEGVPQNNLKAMNLLKNVRNRPDIWYELVILYDEGYNGFTWHDDATKYAKKTANAGYAPGEFILGLRYAQGEHVERNIPLAISWFKKAALQGHVGAQTNLGIIYANGEGVTQDTEEAVIWFNKAAVQGSADAKKALKQLGY